MVLISDHDLFYIIYNKLLFVKFFESFCQTKDKTGLFFNDLKDKSGLTKNGKKDVI